jgi:hypothetical protein
MEREHVYAYTASLLMQFLMAGHCLRYFVVSERMNSTFKLMISQHRRCWKLAEVAGARGLMRRPAEVAGARGQPLLCDRSPSTTSGAVARVEGAPDSGGAQGSCSRRGPAVGELDYSSAPGGPASSPGGTASTAQDEGRLAGARAQIRREPSSGGSSGARPATATAPSRP